MILRLIFVTAIVLAGSAFVAFGARALPLLKPHVAVEAAIVTAGDLFEDAGAAATVPLFKAPAPGTTGTVALADIQSAALRAGIDAFDARGLAAATVARQGILIDAGHIAGLIESELERRGALNGAGSVQTQFDTLVAPFTVAIGTAAPARLADLRYTPGSGRFDALISVPASNRSIAVSGRTEVMVEIPYLTRSVGSGDLLQSSDIEMRPVSSRLASADIDLSVLDLVGQAVRRPMRAGSPIRAIDVEAPRLISRNQVVTLVFRAGAMTLTAQGQALGDAAKGEPVSVLNLLSRKVVSGVAADTGTVTISFEPAKFAALN